MTIADDVIAVALFFDSADLVANVDQNWDR